MSAILFNQLHGKSRVPVRKRQESLDVFESDEMLVHVMERLNQMYGKDIPIAVCHRWCAENRIMRKTGADWLFRLLLEVREKTDEGVLSLRTSESASLIAYLIGIEDKNPLPPHYRCPVCKHAEFDVPGKFKTGLDLPEQNCPVCGCCMVGDGFDLPYESFFGCNSNEPPHMVIRMEKRQLNRILCDILPQKCRCFDATSAFSKASTLDDYDMLFVPPHENISKYLEVCSNHGFVFTETDRSDTERRKSVDSFECRP